jgi:RluA family pseudouridine synthase
MFLLKTHIIPDDSEPIRLLDYILQVFPEMNSRSYAKKALKKGAVMVDGEQRPSGWWLKPGMKLELFDVEHNPPKTLPLKLEIIFEDDYMAVINKPAGISVSGNKYVTIQNALMYNLQLSASEDAMAWPKPVHRLDFPTSGLLLVAKTKTAVAGLGKQFEQKSICKRYRAVVSGKMPEKGTIETPVNGQPAKTVFKSVKYIPSPMTGWITLVDLFPETGRTHQLRIHLSSLGHPVVGDKQYTTGKPLLKGKGLFLSAVEITFVHPVTGEKMKFGIDEPSKFAALIRKERKNFRTSV